MVTRFEPKRHGGWGRRAIVLTAAVLLLLWCTGVVLYALPSAEMAEPGSWQVSARRWTVAVHGSAVWIACVFAGRWVWPHLGWVWSKHRTATWLIGLATLTLLVIATATGLALLYGPGGWRDATVDFHWWSAVAIPVVLAWHARGLVQRRPHGGARLRRRHW